MGGCAGRIQEGEGLCAVVGGCGLVRRGGGGGGG